MNARRRIEQLEATQSAPHEVPLELELYFKALENCRRTEEGLPAIPLTEEEAHLYDEIDASPRYQRYWKELDRQREKRRWREGHPNGHQATAKLEGYN